MDPVKINTTKPFLIIGNCKSILKYNYKDIIDNNFTSIRFPIIFGAVKCVRSSIKHQNLKDYYAYLKKWKSLDLNKHIGKVNLLSQKYRDEKYSKHLHVPPIYLINNVLINSVEIYIHLSKKYKGVKPTRGFIYIHIILSYYEKCNIKTPLIIHGFSFSTTTYFNSVDYKCNVCCWEPCVCQRMKKYENVKFENKKRYQVAHNYKLEKKVITKFINEGKIIFLDDYLKNK